MADWEEDFNFQGGNNADPLKPKKPTPKSHLESILPLDVPLGASDEDIRWGEDDAGFPVYRTATGRLYTVRPATEEERDQRQPLGVKVRKWWDEGANLPSGEEVLSALAGMPQAYAETVQRVVDGNGTYADLLGSVGPTAAPGVASRVGTAFDPSVVSAMGATHKVPRYPKKEPIPPTPDAQPDKELATPSVNADPRLEAFLAGRDFVRPLNETLSVNTPDYATFGDDLTLDAFYQLSPLQIEEYVRTGDKQILSDVVMRHYHEGLSPSYLDSAINRMANAAFQMYSSEDFINLRTAYNSIRDLPEQDWIDLDIQAGNLDPWADISITEDGFTGRPPIQFRDPLEEILSEMEIPPKGITGAQLLKELQDNPTVRMAQLRSQGILDRIDPAKRYNDPKVRSNRNEVEDLLLEGKYNVQAVPQNKYDTYQRQPVADKELNYVEYAVNADKDGPTFKANSQHYQDSTLAHVRLSERENASGNYVLIEELQSDLLQQGFVKPKQTPEAYLKNEIDAASRDEFSGAAFEIFRRVDPEDFKKYVTAVSNEGTDSEIAVAFREKWNKDFVLYDTYGGSVIDELAYQYLNFGKDVALPPIAKLEESVRLGLETAIAHAAQNNIERVVIPPFHRIVEQRFTKGSADYDKAMDPKSGFYQTYVGAVNKVLKKLNEDMGADVEVEEFDLDYKRNGRNQKFQGVFDQLQEDLAFRRQSVPPDMLARYEAVLGDPVRLANAYFRYHNGEEITKASQRAVEHFSTAFQSASGVNLDVDPSALDEYMDALSFYKDFGPAWDKIQQTDKGLEINFSNAIKNNYDLTRPRFAKGGVVENTNPVPPGATPKEVADDVPIMASEGEYVIPANVVRFLGLDKIEKMVEQAKGKLAELDQKGRIGGDTGEDEELPFNPEELQRVPGEENTAGTIPQMAEGGLVGNNQDPNMQIDPATGLPVWLLQMQSQSQAPAPTPTVTSPPVAPPMASTGPSMKRESDRDRGFEVNLTGTAQSVAKWSPEEFNKYARTRGNTGQAIGSAAVSMIPGANIGARMRGNYLERAVPRGFDTMLETGRDLQGNPLTVDQLTELRTSYDHVQNTAKPRTGAIGALRGLAEDTGLVRRREPTTEREPRRLRDVFSGGSSRPSSPKASGEGLVSRPSKTKESGRRKTSTNTTNGKTSSKKKT